MRGTGVGWWAFALLAVGLTDKGSAALSASEIEAWRVRWFSVGESLEDPAGGWATRQALLDSLAIAVSRDGLPARVGTPEARVWLETRLREAAIFRDPRFASFLAHQLSPSDREWVDIERWRLLGGLHAFAAGDHAQTRKWIDAGAVSDDERLAILAIDSAEATGDTLAAAQVKWRRLRGASREVIERGMSAEANQALREGDILRAETLANEMEQPGLHPGRPQILRANLARRRGDEAAARRQEASLIRSYPDSDEAEEILKQWVPLDPARPIDWAKVPIEELAAMLAAADGSNDIERYLLIDAELRIREAKRLPQEEAVRRSADRSYRGLQLAYQAKAYERILSHPWVLEPEVGIEGAIDFIFARTYRNVGRIDEMAQRYRQVLDRPRAIGRADAWWEWARELEFQRRYIEADSLYGRYIEDAPADRRPDARLRRGYCRWLAGDLTGARTLFSELTASESGNAAAAAHFWLSRVQTRLGESDAALESLRQATKGTGYYAWRARSQRLFQGWGDMDTPLEPNIYWMTVATLARDVATIWGSQNRTRPYFALEPDDPGAAQYSADLWRLREELLLARHFGRGLWAHRALEELDGRLPATGRAGILMALGLPDLSARRAYRDKSPEDQLRMPTAFAPLVYRAAAADSIAPELLWSIMRRESFYESAARSHAGAVGLMQFMEHTAESTAAANGIAAAPRESPRVSIQLGAAHLRELLVRDHAHVTKALAAYNAGMHNAVRWGGAEADDPDVYLETIGFKETREYVMAVMEHFWAYMAALRGLDL